VEVTSGSGKIVIEMMNWMDAIKKKYGVEHIDYHQSQ